MRDLSERFLLNILRIQPWEDEESPLLVGRGPDGLPYSQNTKSGGPENCDGGEW